MVVSNGAVQTINDTFVANVISKAVFYEKITVLGAKKVNFCVLN